MSAQCSGPLQQCGAAPAHLQIPVGVAGRLDGETSADEILRPTPLPVQDYADLRRGDGGAGCAVRGGEVRSREASKSCREDSKSFREISKSRRVASKSRSWQVQQQAGKSRSKPASLAEKPAASRSKSAREDSHSPVQDVVNDPC